MSGNKWVRSISFNRTNSKDVERLNLIGKKSFSRYIKKLLDAEIERQKAKVPTATTKTAKPQAQQEVIPPSSTKTVRPQKQYYQPQTQQAYVPNPMLQGQRRR